MSSGSQDQNRTHQGVKPGIRLKELIHGEEEQEPSAE
jgi:hypothetical protein